MNKKTFLVALGSGSSHTIQAEEFFTGGRDVAFHLAGRPIAHFFGVESVIEQEEKPPAALPDPAEIGEMLSPSVVVNVYVDGVLTPEVIAEMVAAAATLTNANHSGV